MYLITLNLLRIRSVVYHVYDVMICRTPLSRVLWTVDYHPFIRSPKPDKYLSLTVQVPPIRPFPGDCPVCIIVCLFYTMLASFRIRSTFHDLDYSVSIATITRRGTGMIASSSTFRPHPGRVIRDLFRLLDAVTALYGSTSLQQSSKGSCSLLVSGFNLRVDCQWRTLVPPLNSGANAAPASVPALM